MDAMNSTPVANDYGEILPSPLGTTSPRDEFEYGLEHLPATTYGLDDTNNLKPRINSSSAWIDETYGNESEIEDDDHADEESVRVYMAQEDLIAPLRISKLPSSERNAPEGFAEDSHSRVAPDHRSGHDGTKGRKKKQHRTETPASSGHDRSRKSSSTKSKKSTGTPRGSTESDSGMTDVVRKEGKMAFSRKPKGFFGYKFTIG